MSLQHLPSTNLPLYTAQNELKLQDTTTKNKCVTEGWERQKIERCAVLRGRTGDVLVVTGVVSGHWGTQQMTHCNEYVQAKLFQQKSRLGDTQHLPQ